MFVRNVVLFYLLCQNATRQRSLSPATTGRPTGRPTAAAADRPTADRPGTRCAPQIARLHAVCLAQPGRGTAHLETWSQDRWENPNGRRSSQPIQLRGEPMLPNLSCYPCSGRIARFLTRPLHARSSPRTRQIRDATAQTGLTTLFLQVMRRTRAVPVCPWTPASMPERNPYVGRLTTAQRAACRQ